MTSQDSIHGTCDADGEALQTAHERGVPVRLNEEMHVIGLNTELQNTEGTARGGSESGAHGTEDERSAE
jgi:hypothetical protein